MIPAWSRSPVRPAKTRHADLHSKADLYPDTRIEKTPGRQFGIFRITRQRIAEVAKPEMTARCAEIDCPIIEIAWSRRARWRAIVAMCTGWKKKKKKRKKGKPRPRTQSERLSFRQNALQMRGFCMKILAASRRLCDAPNELLKRLNDLYGSATYWREIAGFVDGAWL